MLNNVTYLTGLFTNSTRSLARSARREGRSGALVLGGRYNIDIGQGITEKLHTYRSTGYLYTGIEFRAALRLYTN